LGAAASADVPNGGVNGIEMGPAGNARKPEFPLTRDTESSIIHAGLRLMGLQCFFFYIRHLHKEQTMPYAIDVNCDMGESFGAYTIGRDKDVIRCISSANIACGFHASDPLVMEKTVRLCREHGVAAGAHPGYPDLRGFGRRSLDVGAEELISDVIYQVGALKGFLALHDLPLQHVKLHGALYNDMVNQDDRALKLAGCIGKAFGNPIFLTLATTRASELKRAARERGLRIALEAFPDRLYTDTGELLARKQPGAVLKDPDEIADRAVRMVREKGIESVNGQWIDLDIDTLCIHGDNLESIEAAKRMIARFEREAIRIRPLSELIGP
jgi:UPF0271 protein